LHIEMARILQ